MLRGHDLVGAPMVLGGVVFGRFSLADTNLRVVVALDLMYSETHGCSNASGSGNKAHLWSLGGVDFGGFP